jgi:hypothetical protein
MPGGYLQAGQDIGSQSEDNVTVGLNVNGATPSGGGRLKVGNILIGPTALASIGTATTDIAGQWWLTDILIPYNRTITKIGVLQGSTATTDNIMVAIWDSYGKLVGSSAVAGALLAGANTFKELALVLNNVGATVTSLKLFGPQRYFIGVQGNGTAAAAIQTVKAATYIDVLGEILAGTFGTVPATITPPTTWTADLAPVVYVL